MDSRMRFGLSGAVASVALALLLGACPLAADSDLISATSYDPRTIPANSAELTRLLMEAGVASSIAQVVVESNPLEALDMYAEALTRFGRYIRGDTNGDGQVDISDAIRLANALFLGEGDLSCEEAADVNGDRNVDVSDVVSLFGFLFHGSSAPRSPYPDCGTDWGAFGLTCSSHGFCPSKQAIIDVCRQSAEAGASACDSLAQPYSFACKLTWVVQSARCMRSVAHAE